MTSFYRMRLSAATWQKKSHLHDNSHTCRLIHILARRSKVISKSFTSMLSWISYCGERAWPLFLRSSICLLTSKMHRAIIRHTWRFFCHPRTIAKLPFMSIPSILLRWLRWWRGMLAICTWSALLSFDLVREEEEAEYAWHSLFLSCCYHASSIHIWNCA